MSVATQRQSHQDHGGGQGHRSRQNHGGRQDGGGRQGRPPHWPHQPQDHQARSRYGFWVVAYAFAVTMAFSAVPAPLYVLYQARDHFGSFLVTVILGCSWRLMPGWRCRCWAWGLPRSC